MVLSLPLTAQDTKRKKKGLNKMLNNKENKPICEINELEFDVNILKGIINAASTESTRYYLNGVAIAKNGDDLDFVATNSHILIRYVRPNFGHLLADEASPILCLTGDPYFTGVIMPMRV
jgi:DNA polymerase III sliding clamp (beta) subunit (PCNA family)